ncbi:hypothetical protein DPMN_139612 [Dreissena polymorpha]|uniref:Uncharacterized protein n=1 Tax=Dreissena polymorpha TaxID=45954 RepID=A0A9D4JFU4_DREPO|nr:hypothetical protein DPMN_139612 [Dreissena polymorpha]
MRHNLPFSIPGSLYWYHAIFQTVQHYHFPHQLSCVSYQVTAFQIANQIHVFGNLFRMNIPKAAIQHPNNDNVQIDLMKTAQSTTCRATQLNIQLSAMICIPMS